MIRASHPLIASAVLVVFIAMPVRSEVPDLLTSNQSDRGLPIWVSADEAAPDGKLRTEFFSESELLILNSMAQTSSPAGSTQSETCESWLHTAGNRASRESFADLLDKAEGLFEGTVVDSAAGLLRGVPRTLYEVEIDRWIKATDENPPGVVFMPHEQVELTVDGRRLCYAGRRFPTVPAIGGRILAFVRSIDAAASIMESFEQGLFFEDSDGFVSLPDIDNIVDPPRWGFIEKRLVELEEGSR